MLFYRKKQQLLLDSGHKISVIVPALNEAGSIANCLQRLQTLRKQGGEVIVVDGGSHDATVDIARSWSDQVLVSAPGRARQMNAGAVKARGTLLWFVHADTLVPEAADAALALAVQQSVAWGRFDIQLSGQQRLLRVVEKLMNLRSRITGIATGDQGIFVTKDLFSSIGGYPRIDLMEDIELSARLKKYSRPACLKATLLTSSRRWEQRGILRTILLMWSLRLANRVGVPARQLARVYR